ncbi:MAG: glycosyltransferase [Thermoplasmata archaeon]
MKPITVIVPLPPSYRGGTEEYAYQVARRLADHWPVQIVTTNVRWDPTTESVPTGSIPIERIPARELLERPVVLGAHARRQLRRAVGASSLVHLHMPFPMVERWVAGWAARAQIPLVLTYHMDAEVGPDVLRPVRTLVQGAYRRFSARPALAQAAKVVSNSRGYAEESPVLSSYLSKVQVIPKGVDPVRLKIGAPSSPTQGSPVLPTPSSPSTRRVVFVGRLTHYKGVDVLLDAIGELNRSGRAVDLWVAGRGPLRESLEERAKAMGIDRQVHFLGFVPDSEVGDMFRAADVVACPSIGRLEATPTSLEEAASCGAPVVGSAIRGTEETVPHDGVRGILVPPEDSRALAEAIARLMDQPRPPAPLQVRTWADVASDYHTLFEDLMARPEPRTFRS